MNIDINTLLLWSKFNDYKFYEKEHYYTYQGKRVQTSVTQLLKQYSKPFDQDKWSQIIAKREKVTQQEILDRWALKAKESAITGTLFHSRAEQLCYGKYFELDYSFVDEDVRSTVESRMTRLTKIQDKLFNDIHGRLIPLRTEFTVGIQEIIAGNIDLLVWNEKAQEIQIWDYKTNKSIDFDNKYGDKLKYPFEQYDNCNFISYSLQLNFYKSIIQRQLGIKIGKCYLVHCNEENEDYYIYECHDFEKETSEELEKLINATV